MDLNDDSFIVYVRTDPSHAASPDDLEQPIASCSSYEDARRVQRLCQRHAQPTVIRFHGRVGGGD
jgi:hypothetical protein